jgi:hypothetical protein
VAAIFPEHLQSFPVALKITSLKKQQIQGSDPEDEGGDGVPCQDMILAV